MSGTSGGGEWQCSCMTCEDDSSYRQKYVISVEYIYNYHDYNICLQQRSIGMNDQQHGAV